MSTLVLCPLAVELESLAVALRARGLVSREEKIGPLIVLHFVDLSLRLALAGHGKTQFGIHTQFLLDRLVGTELVICAGAAGGLQPSLAAGDVVVAEKTVEHDFKLRFVQRRLPEFGGDPDRLSQLKEFRAPEFHVHFGPVASGDEDIMEADRAAEIMAATRAIAVAWEGAGGARACRFNRVPFLEIRGITDSAGHSAVADFAKNLELAMANVAQVILALLNHL